MKIKEILSNVFLTLPGILFLVLGFQWLVSPEAGADALMMPLLSGTGLNTQIGDIGGLFLGMGLLVMSAVTTRKSDMLFSVALLLSCIVVYRLLAFTLHDATIVLQMVIVEFVLAVWFYIGSKILAKEEKEDA